MWRFLARTIVQRLLLLVVISIVSHTVIHLAPGEPTEVDAMNPMMKAEDIVRIRKSFHLDDPIYLQYLHWMKDLCTGELKSFRDGLPVVPKIWERFLNSLPLFVCTTVIVWTASFPIGIQAALKRGSRYDRVDDVRRLHFDLDPRLLPVVPADPVGRAHLSSAGDRSAHVRHGERERRRCA